MQTATNTIRVIVFKDDGLWVAQCLEYDIGAQAENIDLLNDRLKVVLMAEFKESMERHNKPFAGIDPAPERFQHMWDRRAQSFKVSPALAPWMIGQNNPAHLDFGLVA